MSLTMTHSASFDAASSSERPCLIRRAFRAMITSREREARRYVNGYLLSFDDATLAELGYSREELTRDASHRMPF